MSSSLPRPTSTRLLGWSSRRKWPLIVAGLVILTGMAYSLWWAPLTHRGPIWITPGDMWRTFRAAHYVAWGDIGDIYSRQTALVALPGISVVLAPIAFITYHLGLSESFPFVLGHPTAWVLLGPTELALGAVALFPLDRLAETVGVARRHRGWLSLAEGAVLWPMLAIWGHPEDALAIAFAVLGLLAALRGDWRSTGWWFGLAVVMQPVVVLVIPIAFAYAPFRRWLRLCVRMALPSVALVTIPLVTEWAQTSRALFQQPNYPSIDHATPWLALAPVLTRAHPTVAQHISDHLANGAAGFRVVSEKTVAGEVVAAGPGRTIAIVLAVLIGVWVFRRRPSVPQVVWLAGVALALRCVFEAVMDPYYLWPPLALLLVVSARDWRRFLITVSAAASATVASYHDTGPWSYWLPIVFLLAVSVAAAYPSETRESRATGASLDGRPADAERSAAELIHTAAAGVALD